MEYRLCKKCGLHHEIEQFPLKSKDLPYRRHICRSCCNKRANKYAQKDSFKERAREYAKTYVQPKTKTCVCSYCGVEFLRNARCIWINNTRKEDVYCSRICAGTGNANNRPQRPQPTFNDEEFRWNISRAKNLTFKPYFRGRKFDHQEIVSEAYLVMTERGIEYTRHKFYLLMWGCMSKYLYEYYKSNPELWANYLRKKREYYAVAVLLMKNFYINTLYRRQKYHIRTNELLPLHYDERRDKLKDQRERGNKHLKGEEILYNTHILPNVHKFKYEIQ